MAISQVLSTPGETPLRPYENPKAGRALETRERHEIGLILVSFVHFVEKSHSYGPGHFIFSSKGIISMASPRFIRSKSSA